MRSSLRQSRPALALLLFGCSLVSSVGCAVYNGGSVSTTTGGAASAVGGAATDGGSVSEQAGASTSNAGNSNAGFGGDAAGAAAMSGGGGGRGGADGGASNGGATSAGTSAGGATAGGGSAGGASAGAPAAGASGSQGAPQPLAVGKPATASTQQAGHEPAKGDDADTATRWCSSDGTFPQWWRVDLGAVHALSQAAVRFEYSDRSYTYSIDTSLDDAVYLVQKSVSGMGAVQTVDLSNISARYVRITVTGGLPVSVNGIGTWASFFDLSVTGY